jgi:Fe-S-cluster containining protein
MEITLDSRFIQAVLSQEYESTLADIRSGDVYRALTNSQRRHDERLASAPDAATLACGAGCAWCCHFSVDVRPVEVFRILDYVARELGEAAQARIFAEVEAHSRELDGLDALERMRRNVKCPFLSDNRCSIYPVRPQTCRNYHATNAVGCRLSYEQPDNVDIDPEFAPYVYQAGGAHVEAFNEAMRAEGFDTCVYEMNQALSAARADADARARFEAKLPPFPRLEGLDVPPEFGGTDED